MMKYRVVVTRIASSLNVIKPLTREELLHYNRCAEGAAYFQKQSRKEE